MFRVSFMGLGLVAMAFLFSSCATVPYQPYAREVKKRPSEGGVIALKAEHRPEDRARADVLMTTNCPGSGFKVLEEGEVVVGTKSDSSAKKHNAMESEPAFTFGGLQFSNGQSRPVENTSTSTETIQLKEWQISYACVAGAPSSTPVAKKPKKKS